MSAKTQIVTLEEKLSTKLLTNQGMSVIMCVNGQFMTVGERCEYDRLGYFLPILSPLGELNRVP